MLKSCLHCIISPLLFKLHVPGPPLGKNLPMADSVWSPPNISYSPATFLEKENPETYFLNYLNGLQFMLTNSIPEAIGR